MAGVLARGDRAVRRYERIRDLYQRHVDRELLAIVGGTPEWGLPIGAKNAAQIIYLQYGMDVADDGDWMNQHSWMKDRILALHTVLEKYS